MVITVGDMPAGAVNKLYLQVGCYILFGIATLAVAARLYVRTSSGRTPGLDDLFIVVAWACELVVIVAVKLMFEQGIGWHVADILTLPDGVSILTKMVLWPWVSQFLYFFGLGCIKASIAALYLRLTVTPMERKILWVTLIFVFGQGLSSAIVVSTFLCSPISVVWTGSHGGFGGPACINILVFNYWNAALFIFTDILLALAPIPVLRKLKMDRKKKASLAIMFGLGMLAIGGTISRQVTNAVAINNTQDFTWYWAPAELCSVLESSLGIIFVCVPALAPLFTAWFGSLHSSPKNTPEHFPSDRSSTFGKFGGRMKIRPDDEDILYETQITTTDPNERDKSAEGYEMDHDAAQSSNDDGSERGIVAQHGPNKGVLVNTSYEVDHSRRDSAHN